MPSRSVAFPTAENLQGVRNLNSYQLAVISYQIRVGRNINVVVGFSNKKRRKTMRIFKRKEKTPKEFRSHLKRKRDNRVNGICFQFMGFTVNFKFKSKKKKRNVNYVPGALFRTVNS